MKMVLSIAGSDPSGGAGIQADLKTFTVVGVYGGAIITCHTVQNTTGVFSYHPVDSVLVKKQIELVLQDMAVSHIKIGMVGTSELAACIGEALSGYRGEIIYDPVLGASTGQPLMDDSGLTALYEHVVSRATVLTPNLPELARLSQKKIGSRKALCEATELLFNRFKRLRAIIVKGGHQSIRSERITDYLVRKKVPDNAGKQTKVELLPKSHQKIKTKNNHGTGCTFAAAFAAFHVLTGNDAEAFQKSISFMDRLLIVSSPLTLGHGHGPLIHHLIAGKESS